MKVRRYFAKDMRSALAMVREQQGPDVIILSNRRVEGGVEILTAIEGEGLSSSDSSLESAPARGPLSSRPLPDALPIHSPAEGAPSPFVGDDFADEPQVSIAPGAAGAAFASALAAHAAPLTPGESPRPPSAPSINPEAPAPMPARGIAGASRAPASRPAGASTPRAELWTDRRLVEDMRGELARMRRLIEEELPGLAWASLGTHNPLMARLLRRCAAAGISPRLSRELVQELSGNSETDAWLECLARLGGRLRLLGDRLARGGGWHVLLGPTGVGKTTLAVKLAAREVLAGRGHHLHLVGLDHRRVGAPEQLRAYARVLGLTVHEPAGVEELLALAAALGADERVIVDTAGLVPGMPMPPWLAALMEEGHPCLRHWVFPAPSDRRVLERMASAARSAGVEACCLTRLDECTSPGPALSVIAESGLALSYLGTGPNIPDDLSVARADLLLGDLAAATERAAGDDLDLEVENYARALR